MWDMRSCNDKQPPKKGTRIPKVVADVTVSCRGRLEGFRWGKHRDRITVT